MSLRTRGQTLVLFAIGLVAMLAMAGLIVDGGNAFAQHRGTQNSADAASEAGAVVIVQSQMSTNAGGSAKTDADVLNAMNASASLTGILPFTVGAAGNSEGYYTDIQGRFLQADGSLAPNQSSAVRVGSLGTQPIPPCTLGTTFCVGGRASGVHAGATKTFATYLAGVIGIGRFRASAVATTVAGYSSSICDAAQGCALLPVTFSVQQNTCDTSGNATYNGATWLPTQPQGPPYTAANEVLLSLCKKGQGAFGWLDYGCGNTASQIENPCNTQIYFPTWQVGQPGNPNNVEDELNAYAGNIVGTYEPGLDQEVLIPFFDGMCNEDRPGSEPPNPPNDEPPIPGPAPNTFPGVCANNPSGGGANRHYHIAYFIGFILDQAYVQGNNFPACNQAPGGPPTGPFPGGNGSGGCLKGWFARVVQAPGPVSGTPGNGGNATPLTVQLIK